MRRPWVLHTRVIFIKKMYYIMLHTKLFNQSLLNLDFETLFDSSYMCQNGTI